MSGGGTAARADADKIDVVRVMQNFRHKAVALLCSDACTHTNDSYSKTLKKKA